MIHAIEPRRVEVIDDEVASMYRAMTPAQRVAIACDAHQTARAVVGARIRRANPNWTEEQIAREVSRRLTRDAA